MEQKHSGLRGFAECAIYTHSVRVNNNSLLVPGTVLETLCLDLSISEKMHFILSGVCFDCNT